MPAKRRRNPRRPGVTVEDLRKLALDLPEASEGPCYGTPGFRVRRGLFARLLPDGAHVIVKVEPEQRDMLLATAPTVFSLTPHYQDTPWVIVRLATVGRGLLASLLQDAWHASAPDSLRRAHPK